MLSVTAVLPSPGIPMCFPLGAGIPEKGKSMMDKSYRGLFGRVSNLGASLYFIQVTRV